MTSKLTITNERLAELVAFKPLPGTDINSATRDEWMAMAAELQERRKADSEPVAWMVIDIDTGERIIRCDRSCFEGPCTPLYRHAQPAMVIPDEMTEEQAYEIGDYHGDPVDVFARGANWMRQHIIDSISAATSQEEKP